MCSSCRRSTTSSTKNVALAASVLRGAGRASPGRCCRQVIGSVILRLIGHASSPNCSLLPGVATAIGIAEIFQVLVQSREPNLKQLAHLRLGARFRHLHTNEACGIHSSKSPRHVYGAVRIHCAGHLLCGAQLMSAHYVAHRLMGGVLLRLTVGQGRSIDGTLNKSYTRLGH